MKRILKHIFHGHSTAENKALPVQSGFSMRLFANRLLFRLES